MLLSTEKLTQLYKPTTDLYKKKPRNQPVARFGVFLYLKEQRITYPLPLRIQRQLRLLHLLYHRRRLRQHLHQLLVRH